MMEKRKRYRIADAEIEIAFTENCVKKYWTEIVSCSLLCCCCGWKSILVYGCKRNRKIHAYKDVETAFRRQGSDG